jgi:phosphatidylserine/phosphatidylglycerophosphate/cardiolipin synthase-like enzyme
MGSFNFSDSAATRNDENVLIIHSPSIANVYLSEFAQRWRESKAMPASAFDC